MKIDGVSVRIGNILEHQGKLWVVTKTQHVKPGKGGAFNQVEMKCITDGTKLNERLRSDEKVEKVRVETLDFQYLYDDGTNFIFMNTEDYSQIELPKDFVDEDRAKFLQESMMVTLEMYDSKPIGLNLPQKITLEVVETEPVVKGQTAASSYKPAVMDNGVRVMVPPFINVGEKLVIDTNEITYVERAK